MCKAFERAPGERLELCCVRARTKGDFHAVAGGDTQRPAALLCDGPRGLATNRITTGLAIFSAPPGRGLLIRLPNLDDPAGSAKADQASHQQWLDGSSTPRTINGAVSLLYTPRTDVR